MQTLVEGAQQSMAAKAARIGVMSLGFSALCFVMGSSRLEPGAGIRYAQARGRWEAARVLRWVFLGLGGALLVVAGVLSI